MAISKSLHSAKMRYKPNLLLWGFCVRNWVAAKKLHIHPLECADGQVLLFMERRQTGLWSSANAHRSMIISIYINVYKNHQIYLVVM